MRVIRQIEKHGWRGAYENANQLTGLPHTEESVEWVRRVAGEIRTDDGPC